MTTTQTRGTLRWQAAWPTDAYDPDTVHALRAYLDDDAWRGGWE